MPNIAMNEWPTLRIGEADYATPPVVKQTYEEQQAALHAALDSLKQRTAERDEARRDLEMANTRIFNLKARLGEVVGEVVI